MDDNQILKILRCAAKSHTIIASNLHEELRSIGVFASVGHG